MWIFDRYSPYSYQNNREKYKDDDEKREFTLKECLWFCMTSLTPQGGGEKVILWDLKVCLNEELCLKTQVKHRKTYQDDLLPQPGGSSGKMFNIHAKVFKQTLVSSSKLHHHCQLHRQLGCLFDRLPLGHARWIPRRPLETIQDTLCSIKRQLGYDILWKDVRYRAQVKQYENKNGFMCHNLVQVLWDLERYELERLFDGCGAE